MGERGRGGAKQQTVYIVATLNFRIRNPWVLSRTGTAAAPANIHTYGHTHKLTSTSDTFSYWHGTHVRQYTHIRTHTQANINMRYFLILARHGRPLIYTHTDTPTSQQQYAILSRTGTARAPANIHTYGHTHRPTSICDV